MSWRAGYMIAASIFTLGCFIAAAHFHNLWSVMFLVLGVMQSYQTGVRVDSWGCVP